MKSSKVLSSLKNTLIEKYFFLRNLNADDLDYSDDEEFTSKRKK